MKLFERGDLGRDARSTAREAVALTIDIDPEPAEAGNRISGVELGEVAQFPRRGPALAAHEPRPPPSLRGRCVRRGSRPCRR